MRKSSKSVSLALIGSAFLVGGCNPPAAEESEWSTDGDGVVQTGLDPSTQAVATGTGQYQQHHSGGRMASGVGGAIIGSQIGRALGGGSAVAPGARPGYGGGGYGGAATAPSARGGFGSSAGHASSSASS